MHGQVKVLPEAFVCVRQFPGKETFQYLPPVTKVKFLLCQCTVRMLTTKRKGAWSDCQWRNITQAGSSVRNCVSPCFLFLPAALVSINLGFDPVDRAQSARSQGCRGAYSLAVQAVVQGGKSSLNGHREDIATFCILVCTHTYTHHIIWSMHVKYIYNIYSLTVETFVYPGLMFFGSGSLH